jgi:hypothetical protein
MAKTMIKTRSIKADATDRAESTISLLTQQFFPGAEGVQAGFPPF